MMKASFMFEEIEFDLKKIEPGIRNQEPGTRNQDGLSASYLFGWFLNDCLNE